MLKIQFSSLSFFPSLAFIKIRELQLELQSQNRYFDQQRQVLLIYLFRLTKLLKLPFEYTKKTVNMNHKHLDITRTNSDLGRKLEAKFTKSGSKSIKHGDRSITKGDI